MQQAGVPPPLRPPGGASSSNVEVKADAAPSVGPESPPGGASRSTKRVAVIVCHGMGQQLKFETLNGVATGLEKAEAHYHEERSANTGVRTVVLEPSGMRLPRVELSLTTESDEVRDVHLYETYWAPLAEGKIRDRDVVGFMLAAGRNGFARGRGAFERVMFGGVEVFEQSGGATLGRWLGFVVAFVVFVSLIAIQAVIAAVAAARVFRAAGAGALSTSTWPSDALVVDLTVDLLILLLPAAFMLFATGAPSTLRRRAKEAQFWTDWRPNGALLGLCRVLSQVALGGTVAVAALMVAHVLRSQSGAGNSWWIASGAWIVAGLPSGLADGVSMNSSALRGWTPMIAAGLAGLAAFSYIQRIAGLLAGAVALALAGICVGVPIALSAAAGPVIVWGLAYGVSEKARWFFRQYLGDVAIYVTPHTLDRFWEVRQAIKETASRIGGAIYRARVDGKPLYDYIVVVGHSLGSVVGYDMLNEVIQQDVVDGADTQAAARTRLFLTFGSPLDKIAYVFGTQRPNKNLVEHALAAAGQPLISSYEDDWRPQRWINIYSSDDVISGDLTYFDTADEQKTPGHVRHKRVDNRLDREAYTPLRAHNEYWDGQLFVRELYKALTSEP